MGSGSAGVAALRAILVSSSSTPSSSSHNTPSAGDSWVISAMSLSNSDTRLRSSSTVVLYTHVQRDCEMYLFIQVYILQNQVKFKSITILSTCYTVTLRHYKNKKTLNTTALPNNIAILFVRIQNKIKHVQSLPSIEILEGI